MRNGKSFSEAGRLGAIASYESRKKQEKERIEKYNLSPSKCAFCGKELDYKHRHNKFCNNSCSASFNNKGVVRNGKKNEKHFCKFCGKNLIKKSQKCFCSNKCQQDYEWEQRKKKIEETGSFESGFGNEASRPLVKKYLIEKYGRKCSICGITEWMGKEVPLVVDHRDGNSENCSVDNFRLVCGNCDMQLPTYKSKNKYGRAWRRKYK